MSDHPRRGYVSLTIEMPIEVAEWFGANGSKFEQIARIAAAKAHRNSDANKQREHERSEKHKAEFHILGRVGYRKLRRDGVTNNFVKNREALKTVADSLGVPWQNLEFAVTRFKRLIDAKRRQRRIREIGRLYWAGQSNKQIARQQNIHPHTVSKYIREVIKLAGRRA